MVIYETTDYLDTLGYMPNYDETVDMVSELIELDWWTTAKVYALAMHYAKISPDNYEILAGELKSTYKLTLEQINKLCRFIYENLLAGKNGYALSQSELESALAKEFGFFDNSNPNISGRFGWDATNPIPIGGIGMSNIGFSKEFMTNQYLALLTTEDGLDIDWKKLESAKFGNLKCPVVGYEITDDKGVDKGILYFCEYNMANSKECPEGFKFRTGFRDRGPFPKYPFSRIYNRIKKLF